MKKHTDYITHINNDEDRVYLKTKHFPVNMRLFKTSPEYKEIILQQCKYISSLCLEEKEGYKKPHGMSSANAGLAFNIIGITRNRGKENEFCEIMINPIVVAVSKEATTSFSNCGSLTLDRTIPVVRYNYIEVKYYDINGILYTKEFGRNSNGFTIQHEIDHNLGILITDK